MSIDISYKATCAMCGTATKEGVGQDFINAGWHKTLNGQAVLPSDAWREPSYGSDCICSDCYAKYKVLQDAADEAQQAAIDSLGKFTPTPSTSGGIGTADDPYTFETGVVCVLNAYYKYNDTVYVYMPADAEPKSYDSWEDAEPDFAEWS